MINLLLCNIEKVLVETCEGVHISQASSCKGGANLPRIVLQPDVLYGALRPIFKFCLPAVGEDLHFGVTSSWGS